MGKNAGFEVRSVCSRLSLFTLLLFLAACGGGDGSTVPSTGGNPPTVKTPVALKEPSAATEINFQAATGEVLLDLVSEDGFCIVNQTTEVTAILGDYRSRPLSGVAVGFYIAQGRGLIDAQAISVQDGTATVQFRSLCPDNFIDFIAMTALVRGGERFTDLNSNARYDAGEPYVDEPLDIFMDANFNGIYEPQLGEYLLVDVNDNGEYEPGLVPGEIGNGVYDSDIILASSTLIIPSRDGIPVGTFPPTLRTPTPTGPQVSTPTFTDTPAPPTSTPIAIDQVTNASHIGLSPEVLLCEDEVCSGSIPMFDLSGNCIVNSDLDITALVGDFRGRPIGNARVSFFVETGRGTLDGEVPSDSGGISVATFRSLCPANAATDITIVAAIRGKEPFVDLNSNATYDQGEPFTDLPVESFLDGNTNGIYEPELGEYLINDENMDGQFNGNGNGVWDDDAVITEDVILKPTGGNPGNVPFLELTNVSRISFANGLSPADGPASRAIAVPMIFSDGTCVINATVEMQLPKLIILAGDFAGRPVDLGTKISIFGERGRGIIQGLALTDSEGFTNPIYHTLCPANAEEPITIVAAARGAEPFTDLNSNGVYDQGETFIDLDTEVYLDGNNNGVFEPQLDEYLIWDPNHNGQFDDGGNGVWDADTVIHDVALIIPTIIETGVPAGGPIGGLVHPPSRIDAGLEFINFVMFDANGNCVVNELNGVDVLLADYIDRPTAFRRVSYFVERGRGNIEVQTVADPAGLAEATFRSVCTGDPHDPITLVTTTFGEEPFTDANHDGDYDQGEPFVDLSNDAFLDANFNGIYDPQNGDYLIWDRNGNNTYDANGNGIWDSDTILSDTVVIIPTELNPKPPVALETPTTASTVQINPTDVTFEMFDEAGRCMINATVDVDVALADTRGRPVTDTAVALFNERGRGLLPEQVITNVTGTGTVEFRSLCPPNALEEITLAAAIRGPEPFTDLNSNGQYDSGEPFVDLPRDAFLDGNGNGVYEPNLNEFLIWDQNSDGQYDGLGNNVYDTDNIITATAVLKPTRLGRPDFTIFDTQTNVSRISFQSAGGATIESFTDEGSCIVNFTQSFGVLAGDFNTRPVDPETAIGFFIARGRGVMAAQGLTDDEGSASVDFHNLCGFGAGEPIALVAAVRGQEPFIDLNSNGVHDTNEPFTDLPNEVFLDANLNGIYEPEENEYLIFDANGNSQYDPGGNGVFDDDTVIFDATYVVPVFEGSDPAIAVTDVLTEEFSGRATRVQATATMGTFQPLDDASQQCQAVEIDIEGVALDQRNVPVPLTPIFFYTAGGRATITGAVRSEENGVATAILRTNCPQQPNVPIVIVAAAPGREPFVDQNNNDRHDPGEPFTDLPQDIFFDTDQDGVYEPAMGDFLIQDANGNGQYDAAGNGIYDLFIRVASSTSVVPLPPRTATPTNTPTPSLTPTNTLTPTATPTSTFTPTPTNTPTATPSVTPTVTPTPLPLNVVTLGSQIAFQAGPDDVNIVMFDSSGRCLINVTKDVVALVGDFRGSPLVNTRVAFFVETGRGIIPNETTTDNAGVATVTFRSLCPVNSLDVISIVAAVRGQEPFVDLNSNARYDAGEPFTDLNREAFMDGNDNGIYEPNLNEFLIFDANGNGQFDAGGNGQWDSDNIITGQTILVPQSPVQTQPDELSVVTDISDISFANGVFNNNVSGAKIFTLDYIGITGNCIVNRQPANVNMVAGDFRGRPVDPNTPINIFIERGRGVAQGQVLTDEEGLATTNFHNLCGMDADEPITIVSAARGQEPFTDLNSNRQYDAGEPFVDLDRELYLDGNSNGLFEPVLGEYMIWDPNNNGQFDAGGNGVWDSDNIIADVAIIVPTFEGTSNPAGGPFFQAPFIPSHVQAGAEDIELGMFTEEGFCIINAQTNFGALVEDYKDRPVGPGWPVYFFVETFRGSLDPVAVTDSGGNADAVFRSKCPANFMDEVSLVAATFGREPFTDLNNNNVYDAGEPFVDLPNEAFLDANTNGIFEPLLGDFMIWDPNGNGTFDGAPNGVYDSNILLTDPGVIIPVLDEEMEPTPAPTETPMP